MRILPVVISWTSPVFSYIFFLFSRIPAEFYMWNPLAVPQLFNEFLHEFFQAMLMNSFKNCFGYFPRSSFTIFFESSTYFEVSCRTLFGNASRSSFLNFSIIFYGHIRNISEFFHFKSFSEILPGALFQSIKELFNESLLEVSRSFI